MLIVGILYSFLMNEQGGIYDDLIITKVEKGFNIILNAACKNNDYQIINNFLGGEPDVGDEDWPSGFLSLKRKTGVKLRSPVGDYKFSTEEVDQNYLIMNGQPVFKFASRVMRHAVHEVLEGTGYSLEDVDVIIPHGANMRIINSADHGLRKKGFGGKIYTNLERFGNTSTGSIPLAANEAYEMGLIKRGSLVVNVAFGAGFTYGANLYRATYTGMPTGVSLSEILKNTGS